MAPPPAQPDVPPPSGSFEVPVAADSPTSFSAQPPASPAVPPPTAEPPPAPRSAGMRGWVVAFGIAATVFITLLAISLLYYKWYKADDYQTTIVVWAPDEWKGATVEVTGGGLPAQGLARELNEADHMLIRFHVPPGEYTVRVQRDGHTLAQRMTDPTRALTARMIWWPFRAPAAATQIGKK
ncbi:MAG: hypothetical protein JWN40_4806 [Phycisphaerales bacterium]|nr:hypothetical protein [Phycisphaerales bacterium]